MSFIARKLYPLKYVLTEQNYLYWYFHFKLSLSLCYEFAVARLQIHYLNLLLTLISFNVLFLSDVIKRLYKVMKISSAFILMALSFVKQEENYYFFFILISENFSFLFFGFHDIYYTVKTRWLVMLAMIPREEGWFGKYEHVDNTWHFLRARLYRTTSVNIFYECWISEKEPRRCWLSSYIF